MKFDFFDFLSQTCIITLIVIMMMMLIEYVNVKTRGKFLVLVKKYPAAQIWLAALLGLIPGCVGIFAVVSLYTHRLITFGALLAAAISSFGDEAFFMISLIPKQTVILCCVLFTLAIGFGYLADLILRKRKVAPTIDINDAFEIHEHEHCHTHTKKEPAFVWKKISLHRVVAIVITVLFMVGIITGFLGHNHSVAENFSMHQTTDVHALEGGEMWKNSSCEHHHEHEHNHEHEYEINDAHSHSHNHSPFSGENLIFLIISFSTLVLLLTVSNHFLEEHIWNHVIRKHLLKIFLWVFAIMLVIKLAGFFVNIEDLTYQSWGKIILLFFALLIALIPESGPNLIVLFLFIDGVVPFSTLIANSIVQEGHGGLPLIAERPKHFLLLKAIKFVIAIVVGFLGLWVGF